MALGWTERSSEKLEQRGRERVFEWPGRSLKRERLDFLLCVESRVAGGSRDEVREMLRAQIRKAIYKPR